MESFIKYKRISTFVSHAELEKLFDELIAGGWQIIHYCEKDGCITYDNFFDKENNNNNNNNNNTLKFNVLIIAGKKQSYSTVL